MDAVIAACLVLLYVVAFGAIAGKLAHQDIEIDRLRAEIEALSRMNEAQAAEIERLTVELAEAKRERDRVMRNAEWD